MFHRQAPLSSHRIFFKKSVARSLADVDSGLSGSFEFAIIHQTHTHENKSCTKLCLEIIAGSWLSHGNAWFPRSGADTPVLVHRNLKQHLSAAEQHIQYVSVAFHFCRFYAYSPHRCSDNNDLSETLEYRYVLFEHVYQSSY